MATHNPPHKGRKFTHETAKAERRRKKELRRQQQIAERLPQLEGVFKKETNLRWVSSESAALKQRASQR